LDNLTKVILSVIKNRPRLDSISIASISANQLNYTIDITYKRLREMETEGLVHRNDGILDGWNGSSQYTITQEGLNHLS
jgi:hypothetical protein